MTPWSQFKYWTWGCTPWSKDQNPSNTFQQGTLLRDKTIPRIMWTKFNTVNYTWRLFLVKYMKSASTSFASIRYVRDCRKEDVLTLSPSQNGDKRQLSILYQWLLELSDKRKNQWRIQFAQHEWNTEQNGKLTQHPDSNIRS